MNYWRALTLDEVLTCEAMAEAVCIGCQHLVVPVYTLLVAQLRFHNDFPTLEDARDYVNQLQSGGSEHEDIRDQIAIRDRSRLAGTGVFVGENIERGWQAASEAAS